MITYFHPARMTHVDAQLRNCLKCSFVDRVVVSNHNPNVRVEDKVTIKDKRLVFINQEQPRGCGYRWLVAESLKVEYMIVIDDDMLLFPAQISTLFTHMLLAPESPHGVAGFVVDDDGQLEYRESEELAIDYLTEVYAVTGCHVRRYLELRNCWMDDTQLIRRIDGAADFMVISQSGGTQPQIHDVGHLLRSETYKQAGIAVHKDNSFSDSMAEVAIALERVRPN